MVKVFFFLLGFGLCLMGSMYIILYLNLLTIGYTFYDYLKFIFARVECLQGVLGFIIISIIIFHKGDNDNDLYI